MEARFARLDFAQMLLDEQKKKAQQAKEQQKLVDAGTVSALDLAAPAKAVGEYNRAADLLRHQKTTEAITHLKKAITAYPQFVSAHNDLGLAYLDMENTAQARAEFETAAGLDVKFPGSFLNLGRLALSQKDFAVAEAQLEKARALRPTDPSTLTVLAYAQQGAHHSRRALDTAARVHALPHAGMGGVHYVAASAAIDLRDFPLAQRELQFFLQEDPGDPLAPTARHNLELLTHNNAGPAASAGAAPQPPSAAAQTFPNSERLRTQLAALAEPNEGCKDCPAPAPVSDAGSGIAPAAADVSGDADQQWTIRKAVDEVAVFFSVTSRGRIVSDLQAADIQVRDDNKPPAKVLQFAPQSELPLRLALLVDTSGSVQPRFSFEKRAAARFVQEMLSHPSDLAFVEGFANTPSVTQDFTSDHEQLANGLGRLTNQGGTALFDAVSFACWKLAGYPEQERVARVLVVVTDGQDNSSHTTLKQTIADAETTGVTIYTISTKEADGLHTDADRVLLALAERTGGEALFPGEMMVLGKSFDKLRELIRSRYLLAYKPADFQPDGRYRAISIVAEKNGKRLQVHARTGYHARLEAKP